MIQQNTTINWSEADFVINRFPFSLHHWGLSSPLHHQASFHLAPQGSDSGGLGGNENWYGQSMAMSILSLSGPKITYPEKISLANKMTCLFLVLNAKEKTSLAILGFGGTFFEARPNHCRHKIGNAWEPHTTVVLNRKANCVERIEGSLF